MTSAPDAIADAATATATATATESAVEQLKRASNSLRGDLQGSVTSDAPRFSDADAAILKFHGIYQQDDRDKRTKRGDGGERAWQVMVRLTIPGGVLTAEQYLALDALADRFGNGTLRITTRQSVQFHGVLKSELKALIAALHQVQLTSLAACGDVSRNVMASPAPFDDAVHRAVQQVAGEVAVALRPSTQAYFEVWLDGEPVPDSRSVDPVYGPTYLPRKFKVGVAADVDNPIDLYSYDCGLIAITEGAVVTGYTLLAGGGFGMTHNKPTTVARVASPIGFVAPEHAVAAVRAVCELFRDEGNRADRRHARLKYLVDAWGAEHFTATLRQRTDFPIHDAVAPRPRSAPDLLGAHAQGDGRWFYGLFVQSGRIGDTATAATRTAIRRIVETERPEIRLTPAQGLLFAHLTPDACARIEALLAEHRVRLPATLSNVVRHSMACPALPTCGLALAESERALPQLLQLLEGEFSTLGLHDVPLTVRMTGCPNGCARPYSADIAFVGRRPGVYHVFVGGGLRGDRLADLFAADVRAADIVPRLRPLLARFARDRTAGEALGDFYQRLAGHEAPRQRLTGHEQPSELRLFGAGTP